MRTVLITGTSTGLGRAAAVELAERGWRVFATMRNLDKKDALEQALNEAGVSNRVGPLASINHFLRGKVPAPFGPRPWSAISVYTAFGFERRETS